ncbi:MAG: hypothetical protein REI78_01370 [Pedobacter sp.]|nr:hypothetical protein [Pedobacter sp.]MDQ8051638.1 hypothetical protein [Pedobacter sp.]
MTNFKRAHLLIGLCLVMASCSTPSYFIPSISGNDITYLPRPMAADSVKHGNYLSASVGGLVMPFNNSLTLGAINYNHAYTANGLTAAIGAFGWAGKTEHISATSTKATTTQLEFNGKGFYGGGLRTSLGFYQSSGSTEFRILNWESSISYESGSYSSFRQEMSDLHDPNIFSSTKQTMFTTGGSTEIIWHPKRNPKNNFGFRLFIGFTDGLSESLNAQTQSAVRGPASDFSFYFKLNKLFGIINSGANKGSASKLTLGYAF